jgi:hypothetical protein
MENRDNFLKAMAYANSTDSTPKSQLCERVEFNIRKLIKSAMRNNDDSRVVRTIPIRQMGTSKFPYIFEGYPLKKVKRLDCLSMEELQRVDSALRDGNIKVVRVEREGEGVADDIIEDEEDFEIEDEEDFEIEDEVTGGAGKGYFYKHLESDVEETIKQREFENIPWEANNEEMELNWDGNEEGREDNEDNEEGDKENSVSNFQTLNRSSTTGLANFLTATKPRADDTDEDDSDFSQRPKKSLKAYPNTAKNIVGGRCFFERDDGSTHSVKVFGTKNVVKKLNVLKYSEADLHDKGELFNNKMHSSFGNMAPFATKAGAIISRTEALALARKHSHHPNLNFKFLANSWVDRFEKFPE